MSAALKSKPKRSERQFGGVRKAVAPPHPLRYQIFIGLGLMIVVGVLLTAVYHFTRIPSLQITAVTVVGAETVSLNEVETRVTAILDDTYWRLIPKRFTYLYPQDELRDVVGQIERIKEVRIEKIDRQNLTIAFTEYQPFALWCANIDDLSCQFIDASGYAFTAAPDLTGHAFVRYIKPMTEPRRTETIWLADNISEITDFVAELESNLDLFVTHVIAGEEKDVTLLLARGGELKINLTEPLADTYKNLVTILTSEEFNHLEPGNFRYIDLRFGNKVFVNETLESDLATTTATTTTTSETNN